MPQKKTKKYHQKKQKRNTKNNTTQFKSIFDRTPTPYPYSNNSSIYSYSPASVTPQVYSSSSSSPSPSTNDMISSSSAYVKAVSNDGKHWHIDTDINGIKDHKNLTNSQIMKLLSYPASKQNLRSQLLQQLQNISPLPFQQNNITPNFSIPDIPNIPIIKMYHSQEEPRIRYIYKRGCSNKPVMLNNLSPLHEAEIVPDSSEKPIHLVDVSLGADKGERGSINPLKKGRKRNKSKKYRKPRK
jgi:hypothetical protein